jgi:hypothetical protein
LPAVVALGSLFQLLLQLVLLLVVERKIHLVLVGFELPVACRCPPLVHARCIHAVIAPFPVVFVSGLYTVRFSKEEERREWAETSHELVDQAVTEDENFEYYGVCWFGGELNCNVSMVGPLSS